MFRALTPRRSAFSLAAAAVATAGLSRSADCEPISFDAKGFPSSFTPSTTFFSQSKPMSLSGVGMRRKNFYIAEVDVYKTALFLSSGATDRAKNAVAAKTSVPEAVLSPSVKGDYPEGAIICSFVRTVSAQQVVDAFDAAFVGCNPEGVANFKNKLKDVIGTSGMKNGEEITFFWRSTGGLLITRDGSTAAGVVQDAEIERRLLEVYLDPSRTVSKELVDCVVKYIGSL